MLSLLRTELVIFERGVHIPVEVCRVAQVKIPVTDFEVRDDYICICNIAYDPAPLCPVKFDELTPGRKSTVIVPDHPFAGCVKAL